MFSSSARSVQIHDFRTLIYWPESGYKQRPFLWRTKNVHAIHRQPMGCKENVVIQWGALQGK